MEELFPNIIKRWPKFIESIQETLYMMGWSSLFAIIIGLLIGVILVVTKKKGLYENKFVYKTLDLFINITRSIPFVILIVLLMGVSTWVTGHSYGKEGVIIPLIAACVPFFARQVETALSEVDYGLIEAAHAMGLSKQQIILKVYIREGIPSLIRSIAIALINLLGLTATVSVVGGGGIGSFALTYGHGQSETDVKLISVIVIFIMVAIIQGICNLIVRKLEH